MIPIFKPYMPENIQVELMKYCIQKFILGKYRKLLKKDLQVSLVVIIY